MIYQIRKPRCDSTLWVCGDGYTIQTCLCHKDGRADGQALAFKAGQATDGDDRAAGRGGPIARQCHGLALFQENGPLLRPEGCKMQGERCSTDKCTDDDYL